MQDRAALCARCGFSRDPAADLPASIRVQRFLHKGVAYGPRTLENCEVPRPTPLNNRFYRIFEELAAIGIRPEPAVYSDEMVGEVREQLMNVVGVLVWVDPIHDGQTRAILDEMLREVSSRGPWVSAHPDVILKMGANRGSRFSANQHLLWICYSSLHLPSAEPVISLTFAVSMALQNASNVLAKMEARATLFSIARRASRPERNTPADLSDSILPD